MSGSFDKETGHLECPKGHLGAVSINGSVGPDFVHNPERPLVVAFAYTLDSSITSKFPSAKTDDFLLGGGVRQVHNLSGFAYACEQCQTIYWASQSGLVHLPSALEFTAAVGIFFLGLNTAFTFGAMTRLIPIFYQASKTICGEASIRGLRENDTP